MSIIKADGKTKDIKLPVTTSTVLAANSLVSFSAGLLIAATSSTAAADHIGVLLKAIAATDADYATARLVSVRIPLERFTEWECSVTSGLVAADKMAEVDLTDASTVNRAASSIKAVRVKEVISTTKGVFWIKFQGAY